MNDADRYAAAQLVGVPTMSPVTRLWRLQQGLEYVAKRYLTQSEVAQLAAALTRQASLSIGRRRAAHSTDDAASARLQVIADQFPYLTTENQQDVAALVAAMANGTPDAHSALRSAVRQLIVRTFDAEDLTYLAKACIEYIRRKSAAENGDDR